MIPQTTRVRVRGGYRPDTIYARAGEPVRLTFRREETAPCSERVVFPDLGKSAMLPAGRDVTIDLEHADPGVHEFTCQLGMLHGRLIVEGGAAGRDAGGSRLVTPADERPRIFTRRRPVLARAWSAVLAVWGGFVGLLPHVLHHAGPLAGAALLAGAGGTVLFAAIGFVAAVPFLLRLRRRFRTWRAPAIALAVFAAMFSLSSFVIGPAIAGRDEPAPQPGSELPADHEEHH